MNDNVVANASADEASVFNAMLRKWTPLSPEIKRVGFRFGEAWDGSPAVWIDVVVPADLSPSKAKINELNRATALFRKDVLEANTSRWPYINVETE
jgi:hypothetical protein